MTISNEVYRHDYAGNDSTVLFVIGFYFLVDAHIKAILYNSVTNVETELNLTTHYTLTGAGSMNGGELTMITAPTSDEVLTILRNVDVKQETNYVDGTSFPAEDHEEALDKLTMIVQQLKEEIERTLRVARSHSGIWTLPTPVANYFLKYNPTADAFITVSLMDSTSHTVSAFVETLLDDADSEAFLKTLGFLNPYESTMTGPVKFISPATSERKYFLDPNGETRTFNPLGSFTAGFQATVINVGGSHNIVFDSDGLAQTLTPGSIGTFIYDGTKWW